MRNRYPGTCYFCGNHCEAGAGHFEKHGRSWRVIHAECVFQQRQLKQDAKGAKTAWEATRKGFPNA